MTQAHTCPKCGAPLQQLVKGACPHCHAVIDKVLASEVIIDARGPIWRVLLLGAGGKPKKVIALVQSAFGRSALDAKTLVEAVRPGMPQVLVDGITGRDAITHFQSFMKVGAEVRTEHRHGADWRAGATTETIKR